LQEENEKPLKVWHLITKLPVTCFYRDRGVPPSSPIWLYIPTAFLQLALVLVQPSEGWFSFPNHQQTNPEEKKVCHFQRLLFQLVRQVPVHWENETEECRIKVVCEIGLNITRLHSLSPEGEPAARTLCSRVWTSGSPAPMDCGLQMEKEVS